MKRQDFLDYALKNNPYNKSLDNSCESHRELEKWRKENKPPLWRPEEKVGFRPYDRIELERSIRENYKSKIHPEKILAFISNVGKLNFERTENVSGDMLHFYLEYFPGTTTYWNDLKCLTHCIGYVENCADRVTEFYMSENGDFYTTNHEFIAKSEEEFFDYLTTVEYDFHPVIAERTYNMLRFFGWYEGRCVDTTDFKREMRRRGIELTQKQLVFFSEFSGLSFDFHDYYLSWWFYSLEEMLQDNSSQLRTGYKETTCFQGKIVALKSIVCGDSQDTIFPISVDSEGRLLRGPFPLGRNTIESINHLANDAECDEKWQQIDGETKMK